MGLFASLRRARGGAAAAEMALVLPVVAAMLFAAMDFSNAWATRLDLEQAAQRGIELVAQRKGVATNYDYHYSCICDFKWACLALA